MITCIYILVLCNYTLCTHFYNFYKLNELNAICYVMLFIPCNLSIKAYNPLYLQDTTNTRKQNIHNGMEGRQKNTGRNVCPIFG